MFGAQQNKPSENQTFGTFHQNSVFGGNTPAGGFGGFGNTANTTSLFGGTRSKPSGSGVFGGTTNYLGSSGARNVEIVDDIETDTNNAQKLASEATIKDDARALISGSDKYDIPKQVDGATQGSDATCDAVDSESDSENAQDVTEQTTVVTGESNVTGDIKAKQEHSENKDVTKEEGKILAGTDGGQQMNCDLCENDKAVSYCQKCQGYLCNSCYESHKASKIWKNHTYIDISVHKNLFVDLSSKVGDFRNKTDAKLMCREHRDNVAVNICRSCIAPICTECNDQHQTHELVDLDSENARKLQSMIFEYVQIILDYITKFENLSKEEGTEHEHIAALKHLKTIQVQFLDMSKNDFDKILQRFESNKNDVIELHSKRLSDIKEALGEATCVLNQLHSVCTKSDMQLLVQTLHYFYDRIGGLRKSYDRLEQIDENHPNIAEERDVQKRIDMLLNMLTVGPGPISTYDNMALEHTKGMYNVSHVLALSYPMIIYVLASRLIKYNCSLKEKVKEATFTTGSLIDVVLFENDKVVLLTQKTYQIIDTALNITMRLVNTPHFDAFCIWDATHMLFLSKEDRMEFSLYDINTHTHSNLFSTDEAKFSGPVVIQCTTNGILAITPIFKSCKLYYFTKTGKLENTVELSFIPDLYFISCVYVDQDDNILIGSPNGSVYLLDYTNKWYKKIISVPGPVSKINVSNHTLCVVYKFPENVCYLNAYSIGTLEENYVA